MIPREFRGPASRTTARRARTGAISSRRCDEDEFYLDPTRMTLVCGTAGFDGTQFKGLLANRFNIQINKTSRNSRPAPVQHQQHAQRRRAPDPGARRDLRARSRTRLREGGEGEPSRRSRRACKSLMDGRARPAEFQPLPRRVPQGRGQGDATRATCARPSSWRYRRGELRVSSS